MSFIFYVISLIICICLSVINIIDCYNIIRDKKTILPDDKDDFINVMIVCVAFVFFVLSVLVG